MRNLKKLAGLHQKIRECRDCPQMCGTPVHGPALETNVMLVGQAPGAHESSLGRPFAYTAGKTLFKWFYEATSLTESEIREQVYFAAVARCFPGKNLKGAGDREPNEKEIENCRRHLSAEVNLIKPKLILAVGKVAIVEVLGPKLFPKGTPLTEVVGKKIKANFHGQEVEVLPLPHPSGVSRWPFTEPGKTLLKKALKLLGQELSNELAFQVIA
jgi:uracil-DNA glycosylase